MLLMTLSWIQLVPVKCFNPQHMLPVPADDTYLGWFACQLFQWKHTISVQLSGKASLSVSRTGAELEMWQTWVCVGTYLIGKRKTLFSSCCPASCTLSCTESGATSLEISQWAGVQLFFLALDLWTSSVSRTNKTNNPVAFHC